MRGQLLVVPLGFLEAGSSLQGGASGLQGGVRKEGKRTVRPQNSSEEGNFGKEERNERSRKDGGKGRHMTEEETNKLQPRRR